MGLLLQSATAASRLRRSCGCCATYITDSIDATSCGRLPPVPIWPTKTFHFSFIESVRNPVPNDPIEIVENFFCGTFSNEYIHQVGRSEGCVSRRAATDVSLIRPVYLPRLVEESNIKSSLMPTSYQPFRHTLLLRFFTDSFGDGRWRIPWRRSYECAVRPVGRPGLGSNTQETGTLYRGDGCSKSTISKSCITM